MIAHPARTLAGVSVRNSNARAEVLRRDEGDHHATIISVRCGKCNHRLFDLAEVIRYHDVIDVLVGHWWQVQRRCPRCKVDRVRKVTSRRGQPVGDSGSWHCECQTRLARIDAASGRVKVRCRCGVDIGAAMEDVITATHDDSDLDDVPF